MKIDGDLRAGMVIPLNGGVTISVREIKNRADCGMDETWLKTNDFILAVKNLDTAAAKPASHPWQSAITPRLAIGAALDCMTPQERVAFFKGIAEGVSLGTDAELESRVDTAITDAIDAEIEKRRSAK
jgi:hypothetical protein